nr:O-antigen export - NBD component [Raoultella sp. NCTC 9187]
MSSNDYAIEVDNISKCYQVYDNPLRRLKDFIVPKSINDLDASRVYTMTNSGRCRTSRLNYHVARLLVWSVKMAQVNRRYCKFWPAL